MLVGGWSFSIYVIQLIFRNLQEICRLYWEYLLGECEFWSLMVLLQNCGLCFIPEHRYIGNVGGLNHCSLHTLTNA